MGNYKYYNYLFFWMIMPVLSYADYFLWPRATYYGSPDCLGNPTGACGYGEYGTTINNGYVAAVHRPFRGGIGCGACYQVRCKAAECTADGVAVVATDFGIGDYTDFIFTPRAYATMAKPGLEGRLLAYGVVDIEYRRIPCQYRGINLILKVHEKSVYPHYLALLFLYQGGSYDIIAVQIWVEERKEWGGMRKPFGAVWDMENPPRGTLTLRILLSNGVDEKWVQFTGILPDYWEANATFNTGFQLT